MENHSWKMQKVLSGFLAAVVGRGYGELYLGWVLNFCVLENSCTSSVWLVRPVLLGFSSGSSGLLSSPKTKPLCLTVVVKHVNHMARMN
jgi:hypothetical protein